MNMLMSYELHNELITIALNMVSSKLSEPDNLLVRSRKLTPRDSTACQEYQKNIYY